ncbi:MAG: hypothetical protein ABH883_00230 [Candidatus Omnitrophota bacterium]
MRNTENKITIWIDLLCAGSLLRALFLARKYRVRKIRFINKTRFLGNIYARALEALTGRPALQVVDITAAEERLNGYSLYELIQRRITDTLNEWVKTADVNARISRYCRAYGYNPVKFREHMRERAYPLLFRIVEISTFAEKDPGLDNAVFVLKRTPLKKIVSDVLRLGRVYYYPAFLPFNGRVEDRPGSYYDPHFKREYYGGGVFHFYTLFFFWISSSVNGLLGRLFGRKGGDAGGEAGHASNIGVELIRSRIRLDQINDLFWLKDSGIETRAVIGIEFENYDEVSRRILDGLSIKTYRLFRHPWRALIQLLSYSRGRARLGVAVTDPLYFFRTFPPVTRAAGCIFSFGTENWTRLQEADFRVREIFWRGVYARLGIRLLWSMQDIDSDKLAKAQALEKLDGFFSGSHWSKFVPCRVDNQKCYDLFFPWSDYFTENLFLYPSVENFNVGYLLDYYFEARRVEAEELRGKYGGKFILSYMDNIMRDDIMHSRGFQMKIHSLLVRLLEEYDGLVCFLKPKRKETLEEIMSAIPELRAYADKGRVVVFLGETSREKAVPAVIGMASDLVLGLGISTAAIESFFAGTVSFHIDLTEFVDIEFARKGKGAVVFNDMGSFEKAVRARIEGRDDMGYREYDKYYEGLDRFRDGMAYRRVGFALKGLQEAFVSGLGGREAVKKVKAEYLEHIASCYHEGRVYR